MLTEKTWGTLWWRFVSLGGRAPPSTPSKRFNERVNVYLAKVQYIFTWHSEPKSNVPVLEEAGEASSRHFWFKRLQTRQKNHTGESCESCTQQQNGSFPNFPMIDLIDSWISSQVRLPLLRARAAKALLVLRPQKRHSCRDSSGRDSSWSKAKACRTINPPAFGVNISITKRYKWPWFGGRTMTFC